MRRKRIAFTGISMGLLVLVVTAFWLYVRKSLEQVLNDNIFCYDTEGSLQELREGDVYEQEFFSTMDELYGFTIFMVPAYGEPLAGGELKLKLLDQENGDVLFAQAYPAADIRDVPMDFYFQTPLEDRKGRALCLEAELENAGGQSLFFRMTKAGQYETGGLRINEKMQEADIGLTLWGIKNTDILWKAADLAYLLLVLLLVCLFFLVFHQKAKPEHCFFLCGAMLGLLYILLIPAGNPSDELRHFTRAYRISDCMLGQGGLHQHEVYVRERDGEFYLGNNWLGDTIDRNYMDGYFEELIRRDYDPETRLRPADMWAERAVTQAESIWDYRLEVPSYLMAAAGITLGRLCNVSLPGLFLCGRLGAWLFYLVCIYYAMKKLPFGKEALFVLAMLPMTIQQMCSISYDGFAMGLSFLITALAVRFAYGEKETIKKHEYVIFLLAQMILIPMKHFGLIPILLVNLLPLYRWYQKRERPALTRKRKILLGGLTAAVAVTGVTAACLLFPKILASAGGGNSSDALALLGQPGKLLLIAFNTLLFSGHWIDNFVGIFINTDLPGIVLYPFFLLIAAACLRKEGEPAAVGKRARLVLGVTALGMAALAVLGIFLCWSAADELYIQGVQGRYFIPGALAGMLALRSEKYCLSEAGVRKNMYVTMAMHLLVITGIFMQFMC